MDYLETLRKCPSVLEWETEIRRVLAGERAGAIDRLGSASQYIESVLSTSKDIPLARTLFGEALRRVVEDWRVSLYDPFSMMTYLLEMVGAHPVSVAIPKILMFIQNLDFHSTSGQLTSNQADSLKQLAFHILQRYYPRPLSSAEFEDYVALLKRNLRLHSFCGYAVTRLLALRVLRSDSEEICSVLELNPMALREFLALFVDEVRKRFDNLEDVIAIYRQCLGLGRDYPVLFEVSVRELGVEVERRPGEFPRLRFHGDSEKFLLLRDELEIALWFQYNHHHLVAGIESNLKRVQEDARIQGDQLLPLHIPPRLIGRAGFNK